MLLIMVIMAMVIMELMEAMAVGLPVIAPRVAGIPELVIENTTGLLYTPGRWDQLGEAITKLIEDTNLAQTFSIRGQEMVSREFNISHSTTILAASFESNVLREIDAVKRSGHCT